MKALVYHGAREQRFEDVPDTVPQAGEVLIEIEAVGICGSDMHAWMGHDERRPPPLILGHEAAGKIIDANGSGLESGQRVTVNPLVTCQQCEDCRSGRTNLCAKRQIISMPPREGAFAQQLRMPARNLVPVPDGIPLDQAALAEPIACSFHAVKLAKRVLSKPITQARALVIGGGAIGVAAALVMESETAGSITVSEPNTKRHPLLQAAGSFDVTTPDRLVDQPAFDLVVDAYGGDRTREAASTLCRPGGIIAHIGLAGGSAGLDIRRMTLQEITFIGTYTYTEQDFKDTAQLIFDGKLGKLEWVDHRHLSDGQQAFIEIAQGEATHPKIMLHP